MKRLLISDKVIKMTHKDIISRETAHWGAKMKREIENTGPHAIYHASYEHALSHADLREICKIFPGVKITYAGAFIPYLIWKGKLFEKIDCFLSNFGPFWRLAKTAVIFWRDR